MKAAHQPPQAEAAAPVPVWDGDDYDSVAPGEYTATIVRVGAIEWLRRWRRWNVTVSYELDSGEQVPGYYSLGEDPDRLKVSRKFKYWHLYQVALGKTPQPGAMPPEMLLSRRIRITVADSPDGRYSRVTGEAALEPESGSRSSSASESSSCSASLSVSESVSVSVSESVFQAQAQAQAQAPAPAQAPAQDAETAPPKDRFAPQPGRVMRPHPDEVTL
jgi:hypothetical protein